MHSNIQYLFSAISASNIRSYLLQQGWKAGGETQPDKLQFRLAGENGEEASELWTWAASDHPKFRNRVPNIVFSLSVLEDRPALEIANEMFESREPEPRVEPAPVAVASKPHSTAQRVTLHNGRKNSCLLVNGSSGKSFSLRVSEVVELVYDCPLHSPLDIETSEDAITVQPAKDATLRILQGVAHPRLGAHWSAAQIVGEQLHRLAEQMEGIDLAKTNADLKPTITRIEFELDPIGTVDSGVQNALRRQAAVLTVALANRLSKTTATKQAVWDACAKLLYPVQLRMELSATSIDELFSLAASDDELGPKKTLEWLKAHTVSVADAG